MSTVVLGKVWPMQMPPTPKAVLVSLADNANDHGYCWPSVAFICARTCFGKTAVLDAIAWLEENGYLIAERRFGRSTHYQVVLPSGELFHVEKAVREAHRTARRTGPPAEPDQSARRTGPVREADTNRQEPSGTILSLKARATECAKAMIAAGFPSIRMNQSHPDLLNAAAKCEPHELADAVKELLARGGAPPNLAYVCVTAVNRRITAAARETPDEANRHPSRPGSRESLADRAAARARRILEGSGDGCGREADAPEHADAG